MDINLNVPRPRDFRRMTYFDHPYAHVRADAFTRLGDGSIQLRGTLGGTPTSIRLTPDGDVARRACSARRDCDVLDTGEIRDLLQGLSRYGEGKKGSLLSQFRDGLARAAR